MSWDWEKLQKKKQQQEHHRENLPPQMDDFINKFRDMKFPGGPIIIVLIVALLYLGSTTLYTVDQDEVGVVQRFGKFVRTAGPGLNFKLPDGIEKVTKVEVTLVKKEEFGFRGSRSMHTGSYTANENINESLMLTGDLNVAVVPWIVQYKVKEPYNYLFKVDNVTRLLKDLSESSMRLVIGDRSINEVISKRNEIAKEAQRVLQDELDKAETGINILTIEMKKTNVPSPVQPSFNEVNQAIQEKEKMIYQANEDYNKAIPAARGEADRTIKAAEGYSMDRINRAKGDASRFLALYNEYNKAKEITKRRLYLESLKTLFPKLGHKFIIDTDQKNLLPLLNLDKQGALK